MDAVADAIELYDEYGQHDQPERHPHKDGCFDLLWSLLTDVFAVACLPTKAAKRQAELDRKWISSDIVAPFSFRWCCQHLGLDPDVVRTAYFAGRVRYVGEPQILGQVKE
jgi:hypothetical protein